VAELIHFPLKTVGQKRIVKKKESQKDLAVSAG